MSAGQPDWARLAAMGKLPKEQRDKIPVLTQLDQAQDRISELEKEVERLQGIIKGSNIVDENAVPKIEGDSGEPTQLKCPQCPAQVGGKNESLAKANLKKHINQKHGGEGANRGGRE